MTTARSSGTTAAHHLLTAIAIGARHTSPPKSPGMSGTDTTARTDWAG
ncbi:hypothetical protein ABZ769_36410 [Streptomyces olivoreticuli]